MKVFWHKTSTEISIFFSDGECAIIPESHELFHTVNILCDNNNPKNESSRMRELVDVLIEFRSRANKTMVEDLLGVSNRDE